MWWVALALAGLWALGRRDDVQLGQTGAQSGVMLGQTGARQPGAARSIPCSGAGECPPGWLCVAGRCVDPTTLPGAGVPGSSVEIEIADTPRRGVFARIPASGSWPDFPFVPPVFHTLSKGAQRLLNMIADVYGRPNLRKGPHSWDSDDGRALFSVLNHPDNLAVLERNANTPDVDLAGVPPVVFWRTKNWAVRKRWNPNPRTVAERTKGGNAYPVVYLP